ncbi:MAG: hypothetical protein PHP64_08770, partial [Actinomycetota bacterium]|nr:hypothetical protein [Actinomycetota bacterium]
RRAGFRTGIYGTVDVPLEVDKPLERQESRGGTEYLLNLEGIGFCNGASLEWSWVEKKPCDSIVVLRSCLRVPEYPGDMIARYMVGDVTSAIDTCVERGTAYQYRIVALLQDQIVGYSNVLLVNVPSMEKLDKTSLSLVARHFGKGVLLEWAVSGARLFDGFVLERATCSQGDETADFRQIARVESKNLVSSFEDKGTLAGKTYIYRVGLIAGKGIPAYSNNVRIAVPSE